MNTTIQVDAKPKRKIKIFWIVILAPVVIVLLLALAATWHHFHLENQIQAEYDKIRARGEPVSAADLSAQYALPSDAVDRTDDWIRIIKEVQAATENPKYQVLPFFGAAKNADEDVPFPGDPWANEPLATGLMNELEPTFERLNELAEEPEAARYPLNFDKGFLMLLKNQQELRQVARVLSLRAKWQVYRGESQGAVDSLIAMNRAADTLKHEPIIVSQLVRIAIKGIFVQNLLDLLPHANWNEAQLAQLQAELLAGVDSQQTMRRSLTGERALGSMVFDNPQQAMQGVNGEASAFMSFGRKADQLHYLQTYTRLIEANEMSFEEAQAVSEKIEQEMRDESQIQKFRHMMTNLILPATGAMRNATSRIAAANRAAATLVACQRYQLAHNAWPKQLNDLVPKFLSSVPVDPYDGKPLRYQVKPKEIIVYSIGPDLVDDGGKATETNPYEPDSVFKLKRRK